jgi:hypothetical protein
MGFDCNYLGSRMFNPFQEGPTWEDYEALVAKKFPVRYFLNYTFKYNVIAPIKRRVGDAWYWLKCKTLPSYKFHILDLRKADPLHPYSHGYRDPSDMLMNACFLVLKKYLDEEPADPSTWETREEIESDPILSYQQRNIDEAKAIWKWWSEDRKEEERKEEELADIAAGIRCQELPDKEAYYEAMKVYSDYRLELEKRQDEKLLRLVKIRNSLWT